MTDRSKEIKELMKKISDEKRALLKDYDTATGKNPRSIIALNKMEDDLAEMEREDLGVPMEDFTKFLKPKHRKVHEGD